MSHVARADTNEPCLRVGETRPQPVHRGSLILIDLELARLDIDGYELAMVLFPQKWLDALLVDRVASACEFLQVVLSKGHFHHSLRFDPVTSDCIILPPHDAEVRHLVRELLRRRLSHLRAAHAQ